MDHPTQKYEADVLENAYREMAADKVREQEALLWIEVEVDNALDSESDPNKGSFSI
jgi:hypothetical protein